MTTEMEKPNIDETNTVDIKVDEEAQPAEYSIDATKEDDETPSRRCTAKCCAIGFCVFLLIAIIGVTVFFRIAFKGFFAPKCARPRRGIDSLESLDSCLGEIYDKYDFRGMSVAITNDLGTTWTSNHGYANVADDRLVTADTPFLLSSVSKTLIGTAVMQLVESGVLDLDEDINVYLPFFEVKNPLRAASEKITLRSLSTHTSGIIDSDVYDDSYGPGEPELGLAEFLEKYLVHDGEFYSKNNNFVNCEPLKCSYEYSNIGAALAGYVVEAATGLPYADFVEQSILQPLGMDNSHFYLANYTDPESTIAMPYEENDNGKVEEYGFYGYPTYPDGRLFTSSNDMAKYMTAFMGNNEELMTLATRDEMFTVQDIDQKVGFAERLFYGSIEQEIFWVRTNDNQGHDGGDYGSFTLMYFEPVNKVGIVILTNYAKMNGAISIMQIVKQVTRHSEKVSSLLADL